MSAAVGSAYSYAAPPPSPEASATAAAPAAAPTAGSTDLRYMIEAKAAEKKAALMAKYETFLRETDEQIAAVHAERARVQAECEEMLANIDAEATAAMSFANSQQ